MATFTISQLVTFANDLVCDQGDTTSLTNIATTFFSDELPQIPNGWVASLTLGNTAADTATVIVATSVRKLLAVFFGGRELSHEVQASLDVNAIWGDAKGAPIAWTTDREQDRTIRLYPMPTTTTLSSSLVTETDALLFLGICAQTVLPKYLRLPAALWVLSKEYARESAYRDMDFAKLCRVFAERMFNLVDGIVVDPNAKASA